MHTAARATTSPGQGCGRGAPRAAPVPSPVRTATFVAVAAAAGWSRSFARETVTRWGISGLAELAELLTSELVTNAVTATRTTPPSGAEPDAVGPPVVRVCLRLVGDRLLIEIWDPRRSLPVLGSPSPRAEGGRGLLLVDAMSVRWNSHAVQPGGKVVWCEIALPPGRAEGADLPVRRPRALHLADAYLGRRIGAERDTELLRRVCEGLRAMS